MKNLVHAGGPISTDGFGQEMEQFSGKTFCDGPIS